MNHRLLIIALSLSLFGGLLFYLVHERIVIIHIAPLAAPFQYEAGKKISSRKKLFLYFWEADKIKKSSTEMLWGPDNQENLNNLVGAWITHLHDEKLLSRYVSLESVALSPSTNEMLVSFNQSPFEESWSIMEKWLCIESLCRTIQSSGITPSAIIFLVNNHPLEDLHLDFTHPWPVGGFMDGIS